MRDKRELVRGHYLVGDERDSRVVQVHPGRNLAVSNQEDLPYPGSMLLKRTDRVTQLLQTTRTRVKLRVTLCTVNTSPDTRKLTLILRRTDLIILKSVGSYLFSGAVL